MSIFGSPAASAGRRTGRRLLASTAALSTGLVGMAPAFAAELVSAELVGTQNVVEVEQGQTASFTINLSAVERAVCGSTHTAAVKNTYSISAAGGAVNAGTSFSSNVNFTANGPAQGANCSLTGGDTVAATIAANAATPVGDYNVLLSTAAGTTRVSSSNASGQKLNDSTATTLIFRVRPPANTAPAPGTNPANATGAEGSTLSTSGSFTDRDGNLSSIAVTAGAGTVTADQGPDGKLSGSWSWSLPTNDNVSGSVTVTATDAFGLTATQTFTYESTNVAPRVSAAANDASGNEGDTLGTRGTFADVSGDPLTITKLSGAGAVRDNGDGTWSWSLATTNETSGTVEVQAADGDGGVRTDVFEFTAANVAPGVRTDAQDVAGDEGSPLGNAGAFSDVPADTLTLRKTGDGTLTPGAANGEWTWSVDGADNGTDLVSVTANDGTTDSTPDSFRYTVRNVAPAVAVHAPPASGDEGTRLTGGGTFSDVATDPLTITKVSGPGTVTGNPNGTWTWSYDGTDDETATVVVKADDGDGGITQDSFPVTVRNAAPTVLRSAADATGSEGNTLVTRGAFSDVPADTVTITKGASDPGTLVANQDGTWSWSMGTTDQTSGTVTVTATDDNGGVVTDTFDFEAVNVAPQITQAAVDATGNEGTTLTTRGAFGDVAADNITVTKVSGPGTVTDNGDGTWSYSLAAADDLSASVVVQARDKDGAVSDTDEFTVTASNLAPAVGTSPTDQSGLEGGTLTTTGSFTDVAADTITISKESGDGTVTVGPNNTWSWSLTASDDASGTVVVKADDGEGGVTRSTFTYAAGNVAPTLSTLTTTGATGTACLSGNTVGLKFTVTDPSSADVMSGTINWGDGQTSTFSDRSVDTNHAYAPGSYTITVNVSDDDGGAAAQKTATVSRQYAVGAIQSPYNADGTSVFKYGSTAPVKVRITDCSNAAVSGLAPTIRVALASSVTPGTAINETVDSTSAADTTGVMRYDAASGNYIYNLATKSLADGDAKYIVEVNNSGTKVQQGFGLRTK